MPFSSRDDLHLDVRCTACGGALIIIPANGLRVQHEDSALEAHHQPTSRTEPTPREDTPEKRPMPHHHHIAALTEAFHAVYDIKDEAGDAGRINGLFYACYETTNHLADLITRLGGEPPLRHDGDGRPE